MTFRLALVISLTFASLAQAAVAQAVEPGRYSNVRYIPEAGDYVGLNLEILPGSSPKVGYELCEGWCNGAHEFAAEFADGVVRFTVREEVFDADGKAADPWVYRVEVRPKRTALGRRLLVTSPDLPELHEVLKPVKPRR